MVLQTSHVENCSIRCIPFSLHVLSMKLNMNLKRYVTMFRFSQSHTCMGFYSIWIDSDLLSLCVMFFFHFPTFVLILIRTNGDVGTVKHV